MSRTIADCPDADTCPGAPHEWTPEPTVIHSPRLCLRGPVDARDPLREMLRDFGAWLGRYEPTTEDVDRYLAESARPSGGSGRRWFREVGETTQYAHTPEVGPGVHLIDAALLDRLLGETGWKLEGAWETGTFAILLEVEGQWLHSPNVSIDESGRVAPRNPLRMLRDD